MNTATLRCFSAMRHAPRYAFSRCNKVDKTPIPLFCSMSQRTLVDDKSPVPKLQPGKSSYKLSIKS